MNSHCTVLVIALLLSAIGCGSKVPPSELVAKGTPEAAAVKKKTPPAQLELGDVITNSIDMVLVPIPAGKFEMRDSKAKPHQVKISKPFHLGAFEVTREQFQNVIGQKPSHFHRAERLPVERVSWTEAVEKEVFS